MRSTRWNDQNLFITTLKIRISPKNTSVFLTNGALIPIFGDFCSPCGTVVFMIIAQRRLSTLTQYLTWFGKSPTSTGEIDIIRDRERIQHTEEDHIHSAPMVKGGELPGLLELRARDSRRSKAWFLEWNRGQTQLRDE